MILIKPRQDIHNDETPVDSYFLSIDSLHCIFIREKNFKCLQKQHGVKPQ